jgi:asparagine synthase (glutamine-hydrolysing)
LSRGVDDPEIDARAVAHFLKRGYIPERLCIFRGFRKVLPGTIVEWSDGRIAERTYWKVPKPRDEKQPSFEEAVDHTERLFLDAVQRRLHADVPLAVLLSGGIDSALVCWAMARAGADIAAFTAAVPGHAEDESDDARRTASALGVRHHVLPIEADATSLIADVAEAFGEPFAAASALGMLAVSRAISSEATVVLTGDGGDDLFLGYPRHRYLQASELAARWIPESAANLWIGDGGRRRPAGGTLRRAAHFVDYATGGLGAFLKAGGENGGDSLLGSRLHEDHLPDRDIEWSARAGRRVLHDHLDHVMTQQFTGEYLTKVDGSTMHHGLEARSPFLDHSLWEFGAGLSPALRLHRWRLKAILRAIAARRLGNRVAAGKKRGFEIPIGRWLASDPDGMVRDTLGAQSIADEGWVDAPSLLRRFDAEARSGDVSRPVWYAYVLHAWLRSVQAERTQRAHAGLL